MTNTLPTVVLVHGAWHTPAHYQSYADGLQAAGFTVHCPRLPTSHGDAKATLSEDAAHVRSVIESCVERGERVLLIMHSYGGIVGSEAAKDLDLVTRKAANQVGGVIHLLYLCAFVLTPGESASAVLSEVKSGQTFDIAEDGSTMFLNPDPGAAFFSGLEEQSIVDKAVSTLVRSPPGPLTAVTSSEVWKFVPATYVFAKRDNALLPQYQSLMLGKIKEKGVEFKVVEYDTHHSIWISLPEEMVRVALQAVEDNRNL